MKRLAAKLSLYTLVLAILQVLTTLALSPQIPAEIVRLQEYLADRKDVLYLGDSTLTYPQGQVTTGQILQEMLPECTIGEIAHPAYNLDLYRHYVQHIVHSARAPDVVIIPINMRSFSPEWDQRPGYQFPEEKKALTLGPAVSRVLWRPMAAFGFLEPAISQQEFLNTPVYREDTRIGTVRDFEALMETKEGDAAKGDTEFAYHDTLPSQEDQEAFQRILIYRYMFRLQPDHRQLQAMRDIIKLGERNGTEILFYITPVNYQQGQRYVGNDFQRVMSDNIKVVQSALQDHSESLFLDLSYDLEAFAFVDMEHLREVGKAHVAETLAATLESAISDCDRRDAESLEPSASPDTPTATAVPTDLPSPTSTPTPDTVLPTRSIERATPVPSVTSTSTATPTPLPIGGTLLEAEYLWSTDASGDYEVDLYRIQYETVDQDGQIVPIWAELSIPHVETSTAFPVIVHAAGTTGISDRCAPLNERALDRNWGNYDEHSLHYASQGHIVILPNGLGFDDPDRIHPYFVAELQARVMLDAARAVYAFADDSSIDGTLAQPDEAIFFMGYSSGGHAVFAVKDWAGSYAPQLPIEGIIGFGPTTNPKTLMQEDPVFAPYLVYAYRDFYGDQIIDPADVFVPQWVGSFESDVLSKCVDDIFDYYTRSARTMYTPTFIDTLYNGSLDQRYPLFAEKLAANASGLSGGRNIPTLILQGTADTVVTPDSQRAFRRALCDQGHYVTYLEYTAVAHTDIRWTSFGDVLAWIEQIAAGERPQNNCVEEGSPN